MGKFTKEIVDEYANKLLIGLTDEENKMVLEEFDIIDKNINIINSIPNIKEVEPMSFCLDNFLYDLREDDIVENIDIDYTLKNCDEYIGREVKIPKVVNKSVHE